MAQLTLRSGGPVPPPWLPAETVPAFEAICERLQASGVELSEADLLVVARLAISEADLLAAEKISASCPLTVETKSNGEVPHPIFRRIRELRGEVRAWMKMLPRGTGRPSFPHVSPAAAAGVPVAAAGGAVPAAAAAGEGEPSERVQRLRAIIAEFTAGQSAGGAGQSAGGAGDGGGVADGVGVAAADVAVAGDAGSGAEF